MSTGLKNIRTDFICAKYYISGFPGYIAVPEALHTALSGIKDFLNNTFIHPTIYYDRVW